MNRLLFFVFAVLMMSCAQRNTFKISGAIQNLSDTVLFAVSEGRIIDTILVDNGNFTIDIPSEPTRIIDIVQQEDIEGGVRTNHLIPIITQAGRVVLEGDMAKLKFTANGTPLNDKFQRFRDAASDINRQYLEEADPLRRGQLQEKFIALQKSTVKDNRDNILGVYMLASFDPSSEDAKEMVEVISEDMQQRDEVVKLKKQIQSAFSIRVGGNVKDITLPNVEGNDVVLSEVIAKNRYVLLDFWASWCGPCMSEMPELVEVYSEYKDRGFEIYAVSLDDNRVMWVNAIQNSKMSWVSVSDLLGPASVIAAEYDIRAIPDNFLIDSNGVIITRGLRGEELGMKLKALFNQ